MIVVDTNLLIYLYVHGQHTVRAEAVLARDPRWVAPLLWRSEFRNVLAGLVRRRAMGLADALRIVSDAETSWDWLLAPAVRPTTVSLPRSRRTSGCRW